MLGIRIKMGPGHGSQGPVQLTICHLAEDCEIVYYINLLLFCAILKRLDWPLCFMGVLHSLFGTPSSVLANQVIGAVFGAIHFPTL